MGDLAGISQASGEPIAGLPGGDERQAAPGPWRAFALRWGPALLMMGVIFFASSVPMRSFQPTGEPLKLTWELVFKKGGHLLGYALLAAALCRATRPRGWRGALAVLGLVLLYALGDELHQSFVPGRSASLVDVGIDMLGGGIGVGAARYINKVQIILAKR